MWNVLGKMHLKLLFCGLLITYVVSFYLKHRIPNEDQILFQVLESEPSQKEIKMDPFQKQIKGYSYTITPRYSYEFYGLIVTDYDANNIFDYYHKEDPANTRDVCIVWGDNIKNSAYKNVSYSSGQFTCYVSWNSTLDPQFLLNKVANNHLIPANEEVARAIKLAKKSDQIYVKGYLVDYSVEGYGGRTTSITREDSGGHACEVVYVEEFRVIKSQNKEAKVINFFSFLGGSIALLLIILRFFLSPFKD